MKKIIFTLLLALPLAFISCSDDEDDKPSFSLNGTTWEYYEKVSDEIESKVTMKFAEKTFSYVGYETYGNETYDFDGEGTYTYSHPTVTFTEDGETDTATISGNKMTINNEDKMVYTKK